MPTTIGGTSQGQTHPLRQDWRQRILDKLGDDGVDVELTTRQLDAALQRALELWAKHRPLRKWFPFDIPSADTIVIDFFAEPEQTDDRRNPLTHIRNVVDVEFQDEQRRSILGGQRAGFLEGFYLRWGSQGPRIFYQMHVAERRYEKMTGTRPDWWWEPEERKLYISSPGRNTRIMALTTRARTLGEIPYYNESDFLTLATAAAKEMLGRVLGSLGPSIPGPAGPIETEAADIKSEGKDEWKEVKAMLENSLASMPPPTWVK